MTTAATYHEHVKERADLIAKVKTKTQEEWERLNLLSRWIPEYETSLIKKKR